MPSTYTTNNGIEKIATGEQSGTWGDTTNVNFDLLDEALDGQVSVVLTGTGTSGSPNDLEITDGTSSNGRNRFVEFTGTPGGDTYVRLTPNDAEKVLFIQNSTNQTLLLFQGTYDAARDYPLEAGRNAVVRFTGTGTTSYAYNALEDLKVSTLETDILSANDSVVLINHDTSTALASHMKLQVIGTDAGSSGISITRHQATAGGPSLRFGKSRVSTKGDVTIVQDDDVLGGINFYGADGTDLDSIGAQIQASVDGTPGASDMPGRLVFKTTADGDDTSTERMRINSSGNIGINETDPQSLLHITSASTTNTGMFQLECTNDGASTGPDVYLYRNSASPADDDYLGAIHFAGKNSAAEATTYATHYGRIIDATDGTEDGRQEFFIRKNSALINAFQIGATEAVFNEGSQDIDFRVESTNDSAAFFLDGADGNIGMSVTAPGGHIPVSHNAGKRSFVNFFSGGTQFVTGRSDTAVVAGDYVGGYLFKTNDNTGDKFGGMIATVDDTSGNANLEFYAVGNAYENGNEGTLQLDDSGDLYMRAGGIRIGRSHGNVYTTNEESIIIYQVGGGDNNTLTAIASRDGTGADYVFRHQRRGTIKSEIEENGDFLSATNSYAGTSDERLKENITASGSQWDDIKAVQVKKYSWIEEGLDTPNQLGVIAQDLQAAGMGGLVKQTFKTDAEDNPILDAEGNQEEYLSVKYSILYMKAVKALQEAMERIETLETKVAALEAE